MGKWCQVKCSCPNRNVVGEKGFTEKIYACGHKNGVFLECWQGDLLKVFYAIKIAFRDNGKLFEIIAEIASTDKYKEERLFLTSEQSELLKLEIEEIKGLIDNKGANFRREWKVFNDQLERSALDENLRKILRLGVELCEASIKSKNPIEFYL